MSDLDKSASPGIACTCAKDLLHDILNNNQVAIGYLELALEQITPENELRSMLCQVHKALQRSSDLAINAYRTSRDAPNSCEYARQASPNKH